MTYTTIPSVKGQITIPSSIRSKYEITNETPILIEDKGKGVIMMKVMCLVNHDSIEYYENAKERGLNFPKGVDPQVLINAINEIDG
ncbi:MAG: AbrB/MazE/SpoVT family DNA-binding domain-containing protein [Patescibacteria group bacterium]